MCADFNNDGNLDFVLNETTNLRVYIGNGTGKFTPGSIHPSSGLSSDVVTADFNGDGNIDISTCSGSTAIASVFYGNGAGNFSRVNYPILSACEEPIETADFNNDGNMDIICASSTSLQILLGNGLGTFSVSAFSRPVMPIFLGNSDIRCGDFNGDGNMDVADFTPGSLGICLGDGIGNFSVSVTYTTGIYGLAVNITDCADLDKDGNMDLMTTDRSGLFGCWIFKGNGSGGFTSPTFISTFTQNYQMTASDVNGDGAIDLVFSDFGGPMAPSAEVLINLGFGTFAPPQVFSIGIAFFSTSYRSHGISCGDFNNDGINDIVIANSFAAFYPPYSVLLNSGPSVKANSSASLICVGQTATLTATGANNYLWNTSSTSSVITVSPATTTSYVVRGTAFGCVNYAIVTQSVSQCVGVNQISGANNELKIYPNPSSGQFVLEFENVKEKTEVKVVNAIGQTVLRRTISNTDKINLNISDQASGVYFVEVNADGENYRAKIIKE
ncbi:MAG: T9SS type A sorting domain-containing protein [Sphingobacteriaceae bacterium]|nr:T9SS type A sorting domain-containing protein [Sphingobacteriaceae bacterium]